MTSKLAPTSPFVPVILLVILVACWIELDLYAPSFPQIMHYFQTTEEVIQWTLSLNFLGFFISSLFCGPLADGFGRRPILIIGTSIFVCGSFLCVFAPTIEFLLLGRLIQGIGVSAPVTICMAVIGDIYQGDKQVRLLSSMNSAITIVMALAPVAGVFLTEHFGWHSNFMVILAGGLIGLSLMLFFLPETRGKANREPFSAKQLVSGYIALLKSRKYMGLVLGLCAMVTFYFVFIGIIPLLFMEKLHVGINHYAFYQGSVVGLFALLSLSLPWLLNRFNSQKLLYNSAWLFAMSGIAFFLVGSFLADNAIIITMAAWIYTASIAAPGCILFAKALDMFPELRACSSALIQSTRMLMMAIGTSFTGAIYNGTFFPVACVAFGLTIIAFILLLPTLKEAKQANAPLPVSAGIH